MCRCFPWHLLCKFLNKYIIFKDNLRDDETDLGWTSGQKCMVTGEEDNVYYLGQRLGIDKSLEGKLFDVRVMYTSEELAMRNEKESE